MIQKFYSKISKKSIQTLNLNFSKFNESSAEISRLSHSFVNPDYLRPVRFWLYSTNFLLLTMIGLGGYCRLSGSGLSMTSWKFQGEIPPLNEKDWEREFERYKTFPEYQKLHKDRMTLKEFQFIYFVEWFHRWFGRFTGVAFVVPLTFFIYKRALYKPFMIRVGGLMGLGLTQGVVGWWMVKSGLEEERFKDNNKTPRVSSYRMCFHWLTALSIFSGTFLLSLKLGKPKLFKQTRKFDQLRLISAVPFSTLCLGLVSGPFVAGLDAGRAYNTWPKMGDVFVPEEVQSFLKDPRKKLKMILEDTATVQFFHRLFAYGTVLGSAALAFFGYRNKLLLGQEVYKACLVPVHVSLFQMVLGILTLLLFVPTELGVLHQLGGVAALSSFLNLFHVIRRR